MRSRVARAAFALLLLAGAPGGLHAETAQRPAPSGGILSLLPKPSVSDHAVTVDGKRLDYRAEAGTLSLLGGKGDVTAEIFYTAYTLKPSPGEEDAAKRPITFVFNGGPGAASAYLHLGALGPRVITTAPDGSFLPPPQKLADNPDTWLDRTDLVFVDPVGTGYSREAPGQDAASFWGVNADASAMGAFIRLFLARSGRTGSPVFLAGESYGGFRAALLAKILPEDAGVSPGGIVLISPALEFSLVRPDEFELLHWALDLPALAAVNLRGQGIDGKEFALRLAEAERFATGDYLLALASGLEPGGRAASVRVAELTGLPLSLVQQNFARIPASLFAREFARAKGRVLSLYDGTIGTADTAPESSGGGGADPVLDRSVPVLTSAFVDYVRNELNFRTDISYRVLNGEISGKWDYSTSPSRQGYAGALDDLQEARSLNPDLRVLVVHGNTDLVTPYMESRFLLGQLPTLPGAEPIRSEVLDGGHMMYLRRASRAALKALAAELFAPKR